MKLTYLKRGTAAVLMALCAYAFLPAQAQAQEKSWDTIRIATEGAFPPFNLTKQDGTLDGYDVDLSNALCERMKAKCTIIAQPWDGIIPALNAGKYDAIVAAMSANPERAKVVSFTIPYAAGGLTFLTSKDNSLADVPYVDTLIRLDDAKDADSLKDALAELNTVFAGKVAGLQASTIATEFFHKYLPDVEIREYKGNEAELDLAAGRVDMIMASLMYLSDLVKQDGKENLVLFGPRFGGGLLGQGAAIAVRQEDDALREKLDAALEELKADGTMKEISMKWFGFDVTP
tara:strand:+ start:504 stop:1370 length:867 start_codon:yes stop_codon:yes gene_type:complete